MLHDPAVTDARLHRIYDQLDLAVGSLTAAKQRDRAMIALNHLCRMTAVDIAEAPGLPRASSDIARLKVAYLVNAILEEHPELYAKLPRAMKPLLAYVDAVVVKMLRKGRRPKSMRSVSRVIAFHDLAVALNLVAPKSSPQDLERHLRRTEQRLT